MYIACQRTQAVRHNGGVEWRVKLPPGVREPYVVYVNGVRQQLGGDYKVRDATLVFDRPLAIDRVSKKRWAIGWFGFATYRKDDAVDVAWTAPDGSPRVAHKLEIEGPEGS